MVVEKKPTSTTGKGAPAKSISAAEKAKKPDKQSEPPPTPTPTPTPAVKSEQKPEADNNNKPEGRKRKKIVIPFVLPWENRPALQTQKGMGAFGTNRKAVVRPVGGKPLPEDPPLKSANVLSLFTETNKYSTQRGMHAFGAQRNNLVRWENMGKAVVDEEKRRRCLAAIPKQSGSNDGPSQSGQTPMGSLRPNVAKIEYRPDMQQKMEKKSEGLLTKMNTPNPNCHAGTAVMDKFRKQVPEVAVGARMRKGHDRQTESVLPKWSQHKHLPQPAPITGAGSTGLGPFRQVVTPVTGGLKFTTDEIIASKKVVPWITSPSLASQEGTGGFQQRRDVANHFKIRF